MIFYYLYKTKSDIGGRAVCCASTNQPSVEAFRNALKEWNIGFHLWTYIEIPASCVHNAYDRKLPFLEGGCVWPLSWPKDK